MGQLSEVRRHVILRGMRGRPGPGALVGLVVGVVLVAVVLWLPRALAGDFYEFSDPLIYMGTPMIIISAAVGALIGVPAAPMSSDGLAGEARPHSRMKRAVVPLVAVTALLGALWFFLTATGSI